LPELAPLLRAFEQATGWQLGYERAPAGLGEVWSTTLHGAPGKSAGRLVLMEPAGPGGSESSEHREYLPRVRPLALAIGGLVNEVNRLRHAVRRREAELAAGVPVAPRAD